MNKEKLFDKLKNRISAHLQLLEDKPEETIESTIKACWLTAAGLASSAEKAMEKPLPDLNEAQIFQLDQFIEQRLNNLPLAHITGRQCFMGIELLSDKRALIPRKETEILAKRALEISKKLSDKNKAINVMDICCGAGNLGLTVAFYNPRVCVFSTDLSPEAIELTKENISFLKLEERVKAAQGDLFSAFDNEQFYEEIDLIICNPPYISSAKVPKMNAEISANEPVLAFDGGMFGTKIIQRLISEAPKFLKKDAWLTFEVGLGQGEFIKRLCEESGHYKTVESVTDDKANIRVVANKKA